MQDTELESLGTMAASLDIEIPTVLLESVERHKANLSRLVFSMRSAGIDETLVEQSVGALVDSYKIELLSAIKSLSASRP